MFSLNFSLPFFFDWATKSLTCEMVSICMPLLTLILWKIFFIFSLLNHNRLRRVSVFPYSPESRKKEIILLIRWTYQVPANKFIDPQHFLLQDRAWCLMVTHTQSAFTRVCLVILFCSSAHQPGVPGRWLNALELALLFCPFNICLWQPIHCTIIHINKYYSPLLSKHEG